MKDNATVPLGVTTLSQRCTDLGKLPDDTLVWPGQGDPGLDGTAAFDDIKRSHALSEQSPGFAEATMP
jgi:hypothetical protein